LFHIVSIGYIPQRDYTPMEGQKKVSGNEKKPEEQ
jgi:hypothetical protein